MKTIRDVTQGLRRNASGLNNVSSSGQQFEHCYGEANIAPGEFADTEGSAQELCDFEAGKSATDASDVSSKKVKVSCR